MPGAENGKTSRNPTIVDYLHLVVDFEGVVHVLGAGRDLSDPLLEVEHVDGELRGVGTRGTEQLGGVFHEGLVRLGEQIFFSVFCEYLDIYLRQSCAGEMRMRGINQKLV